MNYLIMFGMFVSASFVVNRIEEQYFKWKINKAWNKLESSLKEHEVQIEKVTNNTRKDLH